MVFLVITLHILVTLFVGKCVLTVSWSNYKQNITLSCKHKFMSYSPMWEYVHIKPHQMVISESLIRRGLPPKENFSPDVTFFVILLKVLLYHEDLRLLHSSTQNWGWKKLETWQNLAENKYLNNIVPIPQSLSPSQIDSSLSNCAEAEANC